MGIDLRLPNITASTEREQLSQIKSYLYQLASQLQWAMNSLDTSVVTPNKVNQTVQNIVVQSKEEDAETSFNSIKALIIKSADIVDAYYEEINSKLTSKYVAQSDFATYTETAKKEVSETSTLTKETYSKVSVIEPKVEEIERETRETRGYINHGIIVESLSEEEAQKYQKEEGDSLIGIEVGQTDDGKFRKYARFTSSRLSFYDQNDNEVAYVSDYKLYIRNVEITSSYKIGGLKDIVMPSGDVVTKWVGGDG